MITLRRELVAPLAVPDAASVLTTLQDALRLEHATIPPYLYSLYSLDREKNGHVADIIRSVVVEEMLHMVLVANVMNALGGDPVLDGSDLIRGYPGPLPGSVESGLEVGLAPCSIAQVADVFMKIEEPEDPLNFQTAEEPAAELITIGEFYASIVKALGSLEPGAFFTAPRHQIGPDLLPDAVVVTDATTAGKALETIIRQGEGTTSDPGEGIGTEPAHYYRFAEIVHGRRLIANPDAAPTDPPDRRWIYEGDPVPFDPAGVFPLPTNPTVAGYPGRSAARRVCRQFNYTYTNLLSTLQDVLTGRPDRYGAALGIMMSLEQQAKGMAAGETVHLTDGETVRKVSVGPSFEYQPVLAPEPV